MDRSPRRLPEARRDITVGTQQIGGAGLGIVARADQAGGVGKSVIAADTDHADASGASTSAPLANASSVKRFPALMKASVR